MPSAVNTKARTVVVIDDEPHMLRALKYLLEAEGYGVVTADHGEHGMELVRNIRPAVILLDIMMPGVNGYQVCQQLRQEATTADTYVIVISAKSEYADREQAFQCGANEYITKPFSPQDIARRLKELLPGGQPSELLLEEPPFID